MIGTLRMSTKTARTLVSTTHHASTDIYLTRIFGGPLSPRGHEEWTSAETITGAAANHQRFINWAQKAEEREAQS